MLEAFLTAGGRTVVIMRTLLSWIVLRFEDSTFPVLKLLLDFVGIYNVHALVSIMEVVGAC